MSRWSHRYLKLFSRICSFGSIQRGVPQNIGQYPVINQQRHFINPEPFHKTDIPNNCFKHRAVFVYCSFFNDMINWKPLPEPLPHTTHLKPKDFILHILYKACKKSRFFVAGSFCKKSVNQDENALRWIIAPKCPAVQNSGKTTIVWTLRGTFFISKMQHLCPVYHSTKNKLLYFEWSPPWHLYVLILANLLAVWHSIWHIF